MKRQIKVGYNTRDNGTRYTRRTKFFPKMVLQGNWLQNAGFEIGQQTEVNVQPGKIEILLSQEVQHETRRESAYHDFINYMDGIFFDGYAQTLASEHPQQFTNQFNEFINQYSYE